MDPFASNPDQPGDKADAAKTSLLDPWSSSKGQQ